MGLIAFSWVSHHSSTLAWKIPWMEEPGRLQSMGSWRVGHDWAISLSLFTFMHWRRKWQPTPVFLPGESRDGGAWWAAVYGVTQSRTQLKGLSSSSSSSRCLSYLSLAHFFFFQISSDSFHVIPGPLQCILNFLLPDSIHLCLLNFSKALLQLCHFIA